MIFEHRIDLSFYSWRGQIYWGAHVGAQGYTSSTLAPSSSPPHSVKESKSVVVGSTEPQEFVDNALLANGFDVKRAAGAGYKILCVAKVSRVVER